MGLVLFAFACSAFSVWSGYLEIEEQRGTIERLLNEDASDRVAAVASQTDFGGAAYYSFFLTYNPPSDSAFSAFSGRDDHPWKHRIRMLALEGQIYESDSGNPALAVGGSFDFAFLCGVLLPLFVILALHDVFSSEHQAGRYQLLAATSGDDGRLWRQRSMVRIAMLSLAVLLPFWFVAALSGTAVRSAALITGVVIVHAVFWALLTYWRAQRHESGPLVATQLLAVWTVLTIVLPFLGEQAIEQGVHHPESSDIVLGQREAVNGAWDLPKSDTMNAFASRHPQWRDHAEISRPFEWKWYYAFQQVGDQAVEDLSLARREAIAAHYQAGNAVAVFSPPLLAQRLVGRITETDAPAALAYEAEVRAFHRSLREFFYPLLFTDAAYDPDWLSDAPSFHPRLGARRYQRD